MPVFASVLALVVVLAWAVLRRFNGGFSVLGPSRRLREMALMEARTPGGTHGAMDVKYTLWIDVGGGDGSRKW